MGLAARVSDLAGHGGVIVAGSSRVLIGGLMAARVGDTLTCPATDPKAHVSGNIVKGSMSVFIDGACASRQGDPTACGVVGVSGVGMPASQVPGEFEHKGAVFGDGENGILWGKASGHHNSSGGKIAVKTSAVHTEIEQAGGDVVEGGSADLITSEGEFHAGYGAFGLGVKGAAASVENHSSKRNGEGESKSLEVVTGEASVDLLSITDGRRIGVAAGVTAQVSGADAKAQKTLVYNLPYTNFDLRIEGTGGLSEASVGGSVKSGAYYDRQDSRFHMMGFLDVGVILGAAVGYDVSLGCTPGLGMPGVPGMIITGSHSVFIGG